MKNFPAQPRPQHPALPPTHLPSISFNRVPPRHNTCPHTGDRNQSIQRTHTAHLRAPSWLCHVFIRARQRDGDTREVRPRVAKRRLCFTPQHNTCMQHTCNTYMQHTHVTYTGRCTEALGDIEGQRCTGPGTHRHTQTTRARIHGRIVIASLFGLWRSTLCFQQERAGWACACVHGESVFVS